MMNWQRKIGLLCGLLAVVIAFATGCAQNRDPIDRVQPNVIKKAMLQGQWYFHEKIVETPGGNLSNVIRGSQPVIGWYTAPQKVAFQIDENFLYIRRVEEHVFGVDGYAAEWDENQISDAIVAAFRIVSHFDIQRDYNPVTGESMNVESENTFDRPWQERSYMRVDWSANISPNFELGRGFLTAEREPVNFYVQDQCSPDMEFAADPEDRCVPDEMAPFFDVAWNQDQTDLVRGYFDITTASVLKDKDIYIRGYGYLPYCWVNGLADCSDIIYYHRNSFWKIIPEEHDFTPLPYKGAVTGQFGFFDSTHYRYDETDGTRQGNREGFAARHNMWEQSHAWNKPGADNKLDMTDMTSAQIDALFNEEAPMLCHDSYDCCPVYEGSEESEAGCRSTCDIYTPLLAEHRAAYEEAKSCQFRVTPQNLVAECEPVHYCTLPYDERRVRPIVYFVNDTWPEELIRRPGELGEEIDDASEEASRWAYIDEDDGDTEVPSVVEQVADDWNAPLVRTINILKRKAAGDTQTAAYSNVPSIDQQMRRTDPGSRVQNRGDFTAIGTIDQSSNNGFDRNWYDAERPPFAICRFTPVLGPNNDPTGIEPDICWERLQEQSNCVIDPANPGMDPKTGEAWEAASSWPICSARELAPRLGDIRYSMLYWVDEPYNFGLLGLGPNHTDRTTGETLAGVAHIYAVNNTYSQGVVDEALLLTGDLDSRSYIDGYTVAGFYDNVQGPGPIYSQTSPNTGYGYGQMGSAGAGVNHNLEKPSELSMAKGSLGSYAIADGISPVANVDQAVHGTLGALESMGGGLTGDAFLDYLQVSDEGAVIESALSNPQLELTAAVGLGLDANASGLSQSALDDVLLFTRDNPLKLERALEQYRNTISEEMSGCFWLADMADEGEISLAYDIQRLKRENPDYLTLAEQDIDAFRNATWRYLRKNVVRAVVAHEIGHSIGLRHNFGGSQDHVNYAERYWDIRTNGCADADQDPPSYDLSQPYDDPEQNWWEPAVDCNNSSSKVGPRFIKDYPGDPRWDGDPISQYELANQIHNYAGSSIMDYAGKAHLDQDGVARYDWAALLYGYGQHMEVYKDIPTGPLDIHEALRPGFVSDDCMALTGNDTDLCRRTIYDDGAMFDDAAASGVVSGNLVVNLRTGEEALVDQVLTSPDRITLQGTGFSAPMQVGDKYAVWGNPVGFNASSFGDPQVSNLSNFMQWPYIMGRYQSGRGAPLVLLYEYFYQPHYTEWERQWREAGMPLAFNDQENRDVRDVREFDWKLQSQGNLYEAGMYADDYIPGLGEPPKTGSVRVPYVYCTDQNADFSNSCNRHDYGTDDWERMNHHIEAWEYGYLSGSFIRGKVGASVGSYMGRNVGRIYGVPKNFNNLYVLYREIFSGLYDERQLEAMTIDGFNSWGGYTMAVHDGFNMLMRTLATPDAGAGYSVGSRPETGSWAMSADVSLGQGNGAIDVESGGRVFDTRYGNPDGDNLCGADIWNCMWNVGWFWDKMAALYTLTDSRAYFLGYDSSHDIRAYRISFLDDFNWQLKRAFAGMLGENWKDWSPVMVARRNPGSLESTYVQLRDDPDYVKTNVYNQEDGLIVRTGQYDREVKQPVMFWRDWANPAGDITNPAVYENYDETLLPADVKAGLSDPADPEGVQFVQVDPTFRFTNKMYALLLGMAGFQSNFDMSFYNSMRMWTRQGEEPFGVDPSEIVTYYDPQSNMEYRAVTGFAPDDTNQPYSYPYAGQEEEGVAAAMLTHANELRGRSSQCDPLFDPNADPTDIDPLVHNNLSDWYVSTNRSTYPIGDMTPDEFADDCCDNPYIPTDPTVDDIATGDACVTDADCVGNYDERGSIRAYCDNLGPAPTNECYVTDNCAYPVDYKTLLVDALGNEIEVQVYGDPDTWTVWDPFAGAGGADVPIYPGDQAYEDRMADTLAVWEIEHLRTDEYLQAHRGLLDFLVKLSRVYDGYLGHI